MARRLLPALLVTLAFVAPATASPADAPPVGPLPKGPVTRIEVRHGLLYAIVLPRPATGLAWRVARRYDASVTRQLREGELAGDIVVVHRAGRAGRTSVVYALTKGEGRTALQARRFVITVV